MANGRHRGAFVFGSILGGAVGAVAALWKTPQSGAELRRTLGFESEVARRITTTAKGAGTTAAGAGQAARPLPAKALGLVEQAVAPLVGVKLGHTANNSQPVRTGPDSQMLHRATPDTEDVTILVPDGTEGIEVSDTDTTKAL